MNANLNFMQQQHGHQTEQRGAGPISLMWYNGNKALKKLGGVSANGGFVVKASKVGPEWPIGTLINWQYRDGTEEDVYGIGEAELAVLASRVDWFHGEKARPQWLAEYRVENGLKPKARNQYLVILKGAEAWHMKHGYLKLTLFGVNGLLFHRMYQDWRKQVLDEAGRMAGTGLDQYTFWLRVRPGPFEDASKAFKTQITPPQFVWETVDANGQVVVYDKKNPVAYFPAVYIGDSLMELCHNWWPEVERWAKAPATGSVMEDTSDSIVPEDPSGQPGLFDEPNEDQIPF